MNATPGPKPTRDFTSAAVWRGSIAAIVAGNVSSAIALTILDAALRGFQRSLPEMLDTLVYTLREMLTPPYVLIGFSMTAVVLVVGYFVMGAYRGDHTTYRAAAIIGGRTAAIIGMFPLFLLALTIVGNLILHGLPSLDVMTRDLSWLLGTGALVLAAGAISGLAARLAAGAPTVETTPQPA